MANPLREERLGAFTGIMFEIRRVKMADYMQEIKDLPFNIAPGTKVELDKLKDAIEAMPRDQQAAANEKTLRLMLSKGVVRMKYPGAEWRVSNIWFGNDAECPDDFVTISDLGTDGDLIAAEIAQLSFNLKGVKALEGFFREQREQSAGSGGEEVRTETVESTAGPVNPE